MNVFKRCCCSTMNIEKRRKRIPVQWQSARARERFYSYCQYDSIINKIYNPSVTQNTANCENSTWTRFIFAIYLFVNAKRKLIYTAIWLYYYKISPCVRFVMEKQKKKKKIILNPIIPLTIVTHIAILFLVLFDFFFIYMRLSRARFIL